MTDKKIRIRAKRKVGNHFCCYRCGAHVDEYSVCARCEEFVCEDCMKQGSPIECIEEIRCIDCHEDIQYKLSLSY